MKITKFGHCCLLIEENGVRILTDPGSYSSAQDSLTGIDLVLITHEHQDHFHIDSVKNILKNNPQALIITNSGVGALLEKEGIVYTKVEDKQAYSYKDLLIEGIGHKHAIVCDNFPQCMNTGYFIADKLFYPGDALTDPDRHVQVLALPVAGPWMKFSEGVEYARLVKPEVCFAVHDGMYKNTDMAEENDTDVRRSIKNKIRADADRKRSGILVLSEQFLCYNLLHEHDRSKKSHEKVRRDHGSRQYLLCGGKGRHFRLFGPERRGEVHDDQDAHHLASPYKRGNKHERI